MGTSSTPEIVAPPGSSAGPMAADDDAVYYAAPPESGDRVVRVDRRGVREEIAAAGGRVRDLISTGDGIAWSTGERVAFRAHAGGPPRVLAEGLDGAECLAASAGTVFWIDGGGVAVAPRSGGARRLCPLQQAMPRLSAGLAFDGVALWALDCDDLGHRVIQIDPASGAVVSSTRLRHGGQMDRLVVHEGHAHLGGEHPIEAFTPGMDPAAILRADDPWIATDGSRRAPRSRKRGEGLDSYTGHEGWLARDILHAGDALFVVVTREIFWIFDEGFGDSVEQLESAVLRVPCRSHRGGEGLARTLFAQPPGGACIPRPSIWTRALALAGAHVVALDPFDGAIRAFAS